MPFWAFKDVELRYTYFAYRELKDNLDVQDELFAAAALGYAGEAQASS